MLPILRLRSTPTVVTAGPPLKNAVSVLTYVPSAMPGTVSQLAAVGQDVSVPTPDQLPVTASACCHDASAATAAVAEIAIRFKLRCFPKRPEQTEAFPV